MKFVRATVLIALLFHTLLLADNVAVGSAPMSEEARAYIEQIEGELQTAGYVFDRFPAIGYTNAHHQFLQLKQYGSVVLDTLEHAIVLEDMSEWKISKYDHAKVRNWLVDLDNCLILITQNNRWFSKYDYRIINETNGTSIEADLFLAPEELGPNSHCIKAIDLGSREITLSGKRNGQPIETRHRVSSQDAVIIKDWAVGHYVILGINSNTGFWGDSDCEALLINVNVNNCAKSHEC